MPVNSSAMKSKGAPCDDVQSLQHQPFLPLTSRRCDKRQYSFLLLFMAFLRFGLIAHRVPTDCGGGNRSHSCQEVSRLVDNRSFTTRVAASINRPVVYVPIAYQYSSIDRFLPSAIGGITVCR